MSLCNPVDCSPPGSYVHGDSPGMNAGVGSHSFLQGIFLTQGSNPGLLHCRQILYCLSHQGSPRSLPRALYVLETQETLEFQRNVCLCESGELRTLSPERQGQTTVGSLVYELILLFQWHPGDRLMCTAYCIPCTCVCGWEMRILSNLPGNRTVFILTQRVGGWSGRRAERGHWTRWRSPSPVSAFTGWPASCLEVMNQ